MEDFEFGLTKQKKQVIEKYPNNAIITLESYDTESNNNTKTTFNKKAYEILSLNEDEENQIAFSTSKSEVNKTFIINANNYDSKSNIKLKKNGSFSHKTNFKILKKRFNTNIEDELLLEIIETEREFQGQKIFRLKVFKSEVEDNKTEEEILLSQSEKIE